MSLIPQPSAPADPLSAARVNASPRFTPDRTPWFSWTIHGAVLAAWAGLFALALGAGGLLAWSVGAAYIGYDTLLQIFVLWHTWRLLKPAPSAAGSAALESAAPSADPSAAPSSIGPSIGIVIAAHNEAAALPATIAALLAQSDRPQRIVIADDGSSDSTGTVLARHYALSEPAPGGWSQSPIEPVVMWLRLPRGGKSLALNAALLRLDTDIVLSVDADTLLEPSALCAVRRAFAAEPALAAITGILTPVCGPSLRGRCLQWFQTYEYIRNFLSRYAWMQVGSLLLISGAFAGYRREAVMAVGGFDPSCLVEDYELIHRMHRYAAANALDWRFRVLGDAQARTEAPGTVIAFLRQRRRWFGGFLQTQYWYRAMVGNRRYGCLGTMMLPVKAIDTLQPIYGLTAFALLVFAAATRRLDILAPAFLLIAAKITVDLLFHLWSVHLYRRWVGVGARASLVWALLAALAEPFSFQLLRHGGAALGWTAFLTGQRRWGGQRPTAIAVSQTPRVPQVPQDPSAASTR
jgi:cellulose synthase/poly-beta-1,6-N-acetylglucosamine synthase-like glycosyltransferase